MRAAGRILGGLATTLALLACEDGVAPNREEDAPRFTRVTAGDFHTCALRDDGAVYCWGFNDTGALGVAPGTSDGAPVRVSLPDSVESIVARGGTTCATADGDAWCWGSLPGGSSAPVSVGAGIEWQSVTPGHKYEYVYLCGISVAGDAYCWGNEGTHLGLGSGAGADEPTLVEGGAWRSIAANRFPANPNFEPEAATTCATRADGRGYCWGVIPTGEVGSGGTLPYPVNTSVDRPVLLDSTFTWKTLQPGAGYICGIADSASADPDRVFCLGVMGDVTFAAIQGTDFTAERLATGASHACRIEAPWLSCWGRNEHGQLGSADRISTRHGVHVDPSKWWVDVAAGAAHTCGITSAGEIWCWGAGARHQIGDGLQTDRLRPVRVHITDET